MSGGSEERGPDRERLAAEQLAAYDEVVRAQLAGETEAAGSPPGPGPSGQTVAGLPGEFAEFGECLRLLNRAWPQPARRVTGGLDITRIGRFEIERLLGHGGFGIVYLATDPRLNRQVALKIPQPHVLADKLLHQRFLREARTAASLDHPHIVPILETGESGAVCYIASAYCSGPTLARWLQEQTAPVPPRQAARIILALADAVEYSHRRQVLHRDLKPANVLLFPAPGDSPTDDLPFLPKLTDFGLAKLGDVELPTEATSLLIGTPVYMSPEQVGTDRESIGPTVDVYSLGIMLYELLIGKPPYQGTSFVDIFDQARTAEPVAPRRLRRDVPPDLETICLKAIEKQPKARYASAAALASDLRAFLEGRPTAARPVGAVAQFGRWLRRNPERSAAIGILLVASLLVASLVAWSAARISSQQEMIAAAQATDRLQENLILNGQIRERSSRRPPGWQTDNLDDIRRGAREEVTPDRRRQLRTEAVLALCSPELVLDRRLLESFDGFGVAYSADGRWLAVGQNRADDAQGTVVLFDAQSGMEVRRLRFAPSQTLKTRPRARDRNEGVRALEFSPDGERLFVGTRGGMIHVFEVSREEPASVPWQAHDSPVIALALIPQREIVASLAVDPSRRLSLWQAGTGELLQSIELAADVGEGLAVVGDDLYHLASGQLWAYHRSPESGLWVSAWNRDCRASLVVPHADGRSLICDEVDGLVALDVGTGVVLRRWTDAWRRQAHSGYRHDLQVSRNGHWLLSSSSDGLKLWDLLSNSVVLTLPNSHNARVSAAFHPLRPELVVLREGHLERWRLGRTGTWSADLVQSYPVLDQALSADGQTLTGTVLVGPQIALRSVDLQTGETVDRGGLAENAIHVLAVSPDGRDVAYVAKAESPRTVLRSLSGGASRPVSDVEAVPVFSPDGRRLWHFGARPLAATTSPEQRQDEVGYLAAANVEDLREVFCWRNEHSQHRLQKSVLLSVSVQHRQTAASSVDGVVRLFDSRSGDLMREFPLSGQLVDAIALDFREEYVVCGCRSGKLLVLDVSTGETVFDRSAHSQPVTSLTGAGDLFFSGGLDGRLIAWRLRSGRLEELFQFGPLSGVIQDCDLSRDGSTLTVLIEHEFGVRRLDLGRLRAQLRDLDLDW